MNYYALDEALAYLNGDEYSLFNENFEELEALAEGINIKEAAKKFWEKIKEAFVKLKNKLVEIFQKVRRFFKGGKLKSQIKLLDDFKKNRVRPVEEAATVKASELKEHSCTLVDFGYIANLLIILDDIPHDRNASYVDDDKFEKVKQDFTKHLEEAESKTFYKSNLLEFDRKIDDILDDLYTIQRHYPLTESFINDDIENVEHWIKLTSDELDRIKNSTNDEASLERREEDKKQLQKELANLTLVTKWLAETMNLIIRASSAITNAALNYRSFTK